MTEIVNLTMRRLLLWPGIKSVKWICLMFCKDWTLKLSEEVAYIYINVARKARQIPALKEEIRKGTITVTKAKKITSVINAANQSHWLELARTASKAKLEKEVAAHSPGLAVRDKMTYVNPSLEIREAKSYSGPPLWKKFCGL